MIQRDPARSSVIQRDHGRLESVSRPVDRPRPRQHEGRTNDTQSSIERKPNSRSQPTDSQSATDQQPIHNQPTLGHQSISDGRYGQSYEYEHEREHESNHVYSNGCTACRVHTARPTASQRATETASANASEAVIARTIASAIANVADNKNHLTRTNLRIRLDRIRHDHLDQLDR